MSGIDGLAQIKTHMGVTKEFTDYENLDDTGADDVFSEEEIRLLLADVLGLDDNNPEIDIIIDALKEDQGITGNTPLTMGNAELSDFLDIDDDAIIDETDIATTGGEGAIKHIIAKGDGVDANNKDITGSTQIKSLGPAEKNVVLETLQGMVNDTVSANQIRDFYDHASDAGWTLEGVFNRLDGKIQNSQDDETYLYSISGDDEYSGITNDEDITLREASYAILEIIGQNDGVMTRRLDKNLDIAALENATGADGKLNETQLQTILSEDYGLAAEKIDAIIPNILGEDRTSISVKDLVAIVDLDNSGSLSITEFEHFIDTKNTTEKINVSNIEQGHKGSDSHYGDCWFLAGIMAIGNTPEGQDALDRAITQNEDGSYTVVFPSDTRKSYNVTADDIDNNGDMSLDNTLVRVLEIAAVQYLENHSGALGGDDTSASAKDDFEGGDSEGVAKLFNINHETQYFNFDDQDSNQNITDYLETYVEEHHPNISLTFGAHSGHPEDMVPVSAAEARGGGYGRHEWTITNIDVDAEEVTYVNPWDSEQPQTVSFDEFKTYSIFQIVALETEGENSALSGATEGAGPERREELQHKKAVSGLTAEEENELSTMQDEFMTQMVTKAESEDLTADDRYEMQEYIYNALSAIDLQNDKNYVKLIRDVLGGPDNLHMFRDEFSAAMAEIYIDTEPKQNDMIGAYENALFYEDGLYHDENALNFNNSNYHQEAKDMMLSLGEAFGDAYDGQRGMRMDHMNDLLESVNSDGRKEWLKEGWNESDKTGEGNEYDPVSDDDSSPSWTKPWEFLSTS